MQSFKLSRYNILVPYENILIAYNARTNNLISLDHGEYHDLVESLRKGEFDPNGDLKHFERMGYVVAADRDELNEVIRNFERKKYSYTSLVLTIALTNACNLNCTYCYVKNNEPAHMPERVQDAIVAFVKKYHEAFHNRELSITWTGGEPLLDIGILQSLTERLRQYCLDQNIEYSARIITNGVMLTTDSLDRLRASSISSIQISLEPNVNIDRAMRPMVGGDGSAGSIAYQNIRENAGSVPIVIKLTLTRKNKSDIIDFIRRYHADGLNEKNVKYAVSPLHLTLSSTPDVLQSCYSADEYAHHFFDIYEQLWQGGVITIDELPHPTLTKDCGACKDSVFCVDANGDMYKCFENVFNPDESIGSILQGFPAPNFNNMQWVMNEFNFKELPCGHCEILPVCKGGCPMVRRFVAESPIGHMFKMGCPQWKYALDKGMTLCYLAKRTQQPSPAMMP